MEVATQLALFLINILAFSMSDTVDHTVLRMVVSEPRRALALFEERGALVVASEVLLLQGENRPGSLAALASRLSEAHINIEYAYSATSPRARSGLLVMRVTNVRKALKVLNMAPR